MEVTAALTVPNEDNITKVQQALDAFNKSGVIGIMPWIALHWGPEGRYRVEKKKKGLITEVNIFCEEIIQHDTTVGQRKNLSPRRESNPWPPRYRLGALTN